MTQGWNMQTRADRYLNALRLAKDCNELGARTRTIHHLTGLPPRELQRLFFNAAKAAPRGRAPDSPEWYYGANLLYRAESSIFVCAFRRLRDSGFAAGESLVGAYRHYQAVCQGPHRISFDRAFDLASHTDAIWLAKSSAFSVVTCPVCGSEFLAAAGTVASSNDRCPFCRLLQRYDTDQRVRYSFPMHSLANAGAMQTRLAALVFPGRPPEGEGDTTAQ